MTSRRLYFYLSSSWAFIAACTDPPSQGPLDVSSKDSEAYADAEPADISPADAGAADAAGYPDATYPDAGLPDAHPPDVDGGAFWANLQYPPYLTLPPNMSASIYGQVWIDGLTAQPGATPTLSAELVFGAPGVDISQWQSVAATYHLDSGNNDEFIAQWTPTTGVWHYGYRYRLSQPQVWQDGLWADRSDQGRGGTSDGFLLKDTGIAAVRNPSENIELATQNLRCLADDPQARLEAIAQKYAEIGVDIIGLQEVCLGPPFSVDTAAVLAQKLRDKTGLPWHHRFVQTHLANNTTPEGIGWVSRWPAADIIVQDLPAGDFPRKVLVGIFGSHLGMLAFAVVHFSYRAEDGPTRLAQAQRVLGILDGLTSLGASAIVGDFNSGPTEPPAFALTSAGYADAYLVAGPGDPGHTFPAQAPDRRIDYIFVRAQTPWAVDLSSAAVEFSQPYANNAWVSDHRGVRVVVQARP